MPAPVALAGTDITADAGSYMLPVAAVKGADQSVTSSTVLVNDSALVVAVAANYTYEIELVLFWLPANASTTPGLGFSWTAPAGVTMEYGVLSSNAAGTSALLGASTAPGTLINGIAGAGSAVNVLIVKGILIVAGTAGNLQLQWAQNVSSGTSTTVKANSFLVARRIA